MDKLRKNHYRRSVKMGLFDFLGTKNIGTSAEEVNTVLELDVTQIIPNEYQPRQIFDEQALEDLAASIDEHGILQPIVVRKNDMNQYEIVAGERRFRASQLVGMTKVPVIVKEMTNEQSAALAIIENIQRENLSVVEEALAYQQLMILHGLKQEELAKRIGKNQSTVANKLRLLKLSQPVKDALNTRNITERHGRALLKVKEPIKQTELLEMIVASQLNVAQTEALIVQYLSDQEQEELTQEPKKVIRKRASKDVRLAMNTIKQTVQQIQKFGHQVEINESDHDEYYEVTIRLPKNS